MKTSQKIELYYFIYQAIREKTRVKIKQLAHSLDLSGRGRTFKVVSDYLHSMYENKISLKPRLNLRVFENSSITAYFLRAKSRRKLSSTFQNLAEDPRISKVLYLAGMYDFLVTARLDDLNLKQYNVRVAKKTHMYTPIFTIPHGWKNDVKDTLQLFAKSSLKKGNLERELEDFLPWSDLDWRIYHSMKTNARKPFTHVGKSASVTSDTVKRHFYESIVPYCDIAHYFFPRGYSHYHQSFIIVQSEYEKDLVTCLSVLPCTSYVYPLENELVLSIFHEGVTHLMTAFQKLEEAGYIDNYLLLVPLAHW